MYLESNNMKIENTRPFGSKGFVGTYDDSEGEQIVDIVDEECSMCSNFDCMLCFSKDNIDSWEWWFKDEVSISCIGFK